MKKTITLTIIAAGLAAATALPALSQDRQNRDDRRPPRPPEPEELAVELIETFDVDGDMALNYDELVEALTEMRERHRAHRPPRRDRDFEGGQNERY